MPEIEHPQAKEDIEQIPADHKIAGGKHTPSAIVGESVESPVASAVLASVACDEADKSIEVEQPDILEEDEEVQIEMAREMMGSGTAEKLDISEGEIKRMSDEFLIERLEDSIALYHIKEKPSER